MTSIHWDEIESIEYIDPKDLNNSEYVYDFSVEDVETFATKEGVIVHNTLNSIDYNQKVVIRINKKKYIAIQIGEFIEKINQDYDKKYKTYFEKGDQTFIEVNKQNENYEIYAVDWDGKYKWCELEAVTKHLPLVDGKRDNLIKITLESNRTAIGTKAKSFLRYNNVLNKIEPCGGDDINIGDEIPILKKFNVPTKEQLQFLELEQYFPKTEYLYGNEAVKALMWKNYGIYKSNFNKKNNWFKRFNGNKFVVPYSRSDSFMDIFKRRIEIPQQNFIYHQRSSSKKFPLKLPEKIKLDELFGFFIGAYLAEGLANKNQIKISNNNKDFRNRIYDFCDKYNLGYYTTERLFGDKNSTEIKSYTYKDRKEDKTAISTTFTKYEKTKKYRNGISTDITIYHTMLSDLLKVLCNTGSKNKKVPDFCYMANDKFIRGLLDGYLSGDGSVSISTFRYCTISEDLGQGIALLLKRFGIHTKKISRDDKRKKHYNRCYTYTLKNYKNFIYLKLTYLKKQINLYKSLYKNEKSMNYFNENILEKVIKKEEIASSHKYVYDFTVKDNPNFMLFNGIPGKNTFHMAGVSSKSNVNKGIPRIRELISITKNPKTPSLTIFLNEKNNSKKMAKNVLNNIENTKIKNFINSTSIYYDKDILNCCIDEDKDFVKEYYNFHNDMELEQLSPWLLRIEFNQLFLVNKMISMFEIYSFLLKTYEKKKLHIIYSNDNSAKSIFHIRFYYTNIKAVDENDFLLTNNDQFLLNNLEEDIVNKAIRGISSIKKVVMREINNNYIKKTGEISIKKQIVLDTTGTNMKEILFNDNINKYNTFSNDIHEIYNLLGVEAARILLKNEIIDVMNESGIYINDKHLNLLVDSITVKGNLISMDRHGIIKSDTGILTKMSFEESHEHLINASIFNKKDNMQSLTSNLIMGQVGKFGTGICNLIFCNKTLQKYMHANKIQKIQTRKIINLNKN